MTTQELRSENTHRNFRRNIVRRRRECMHKTLESKIDYKDVVTLRRYITDRGRIIPAKRTGNCAKCQRELNTAIKRARFLAFLPYSPQHLKLTGKILSDTTVIDSEDSKSSDQSTPAASTDSKSSDESTPAASTDSKSSDESTPAASTDSKSKE